MLSLARKTDLPMRKYSAILILFLFLSLKGKAQQVTCPETSQEYLDMLMQELTYLASDELGGRYPGSEGAEAAATFLKDKFREIGLAPAFNGQYGQKFNIPVNVDVDSAATYLVVKKDTLSLRENFYPVSYSTNGMAEGETEYVGYGIEDEELGWNDFKGIDVDGKIAVLNISSPDGIHPHSAYVKYHSLKERIALLQRKGARGVILIDPDKTGRPPQTKFTKMHSGRRMPVLYVSSKKWVKKFKKKNLQVALAVSMKNQEIATENVGGYIENGVGRTVIIGAHYDHLGLGKENSLYKPKEGETYQIHNGADDNASGTSGLLFLAREIMRNPELYGNYNYTFIAFSGEEKGLLGSSYFVEDIPGEIGAPVYMLNMDMIGRMEEGQLEVSGTGTSPIWEEILNQMACKLDVKKTKSGTGPSDHTSFYYQNIPVLHFFTGTHYDYHKPSDDADKINFEGVKQVLGYILGVIQLSQPYPEFEFTATKSAHDGATPRFTVTLGIMPDYMYQDGGVKVDGVTEGKPASGAGIKVGDVILKLGDISTDDMMMYMEALSAFKPGDKTTVTYKRGDTKETKPLKF